MPSRRWWILRLAPACMVTCDVHHWLLGTAQACLRRWLIPTFFSFSNSRLRSVALTLLGEGSLSFHHMSQSINESRTLQDATITVRSSHSTLQHNILHSFLHGGTMNCVHERPNKLPHSNKKAYLPAPALALSTNRAPTCTIDGIAYSLVPRLDWTYQHCCTSPQFVCHPASLGASSDSSDTNLAQGLMRRQQPIIFGAR